MFEFGDDLKWICGAKVGLYKGLSEVSEEFDLFCYFKYFFFVSVHDSRENDSNNIDSINGK